MRCRIMLARGHTWHEAGVCVFGYASGFIGSRVVQYQFIWIKFRFVPTGFRESRMQAVDILSRPLRDAYETRHIPLRNEWQAGDKQSRSVREI